MGIHPRTFLAQSEAQVGRGLVLAQAPEPRIAVIKAEVK
jgi:hypothetical protein